MWLWWRARASEEKAGGQQSSTISLRIILMREKSWWKKNDSSWIIPRVTILCATRKFQKNLSRAFWCKLLFIFYKQTYMFFFQIFFSRERNLVMNDSSEDLMIFFVIIRLEFSEFSVGQVRKSNVEFGFHYRRGH